MKPISTDRQFGFYPCTIGTSLALEGLFHTGEFDSDKTEPVFNKYQNLYINIRTLMRNAFGSFGDKKAYLDSEIVMTAITEDIETIIDTVNSVSPSMVCVPYLCLYKSVNRVFKEARFLESDNPTPGQIHYRSIEQDIYRRVHNEQLFDTRIFDVEIEGKEDTLIISHLAADLLCYKNFPLLSLLESHTGKVKKRLEWNTKLNNKPKNVPFTRATLQLLGDGVMFSPVDRKLVKVFLATAEKYKWAADTTMDRIYVGLRASNEPHLVNYLKRLDA